MREEGIIQGLDLSKIIHSFNKNEAALFGSASQKRFEKRTNVLLLGDSLGDSDMANGCPPNANVLKIGFLWDKVCNCHLKFKINHPPAIEGQTYIVMLMNIRQFLNLIYYQ